MILNDLIQRQAKAKQWLANGNLTKTEYTNYMKWGFNQIEKQELKERDLHE